MVGRLTLSYYRLRVRFFAEKDLYVRAWIGAVLRNNFFAAAEEVWDDQGISLYERLNTLNLPSDHPDYSQYIGGFPKGVFFDCRDLLGYNQETAIKAETVQSFTMVIVGNQLQYYPLIIQAIEYMFRKGLGHPVVPLCLVDVSEYDEEGNRFSIYLPGSDVSQLPQFAIRFSDYIQNGYLSEPLTLQLNFLTPVSLIRSKLNKEVSALSAQDKMNCFPSFYQFVRSLVYRINTLNLLYTDNTDSLKQDEIEEYLLKTSEVILAKANICFHKVRSTPKKERHNVYVMEGYTGSLVWTNVHPKYLSLLTFGSNLGVGYNIQYGLGAYDVTVIE